MTRASDPEALFFTELFHRYSVVRSKLQEVFMNLSDKKCVPCEGGTKPYGDAEITEMLKKVPGWSVQYNRLYKEFKFRNFTDNMAFLNTKSPNWPKRRGIIPTSACITTEPSLKSGRMRLTVCRRMILFWRQKLTNYKINSRADDLTELL